MSDEVLGRGHRTVHKTGYMLAHDKSVKDSESRRNNRKRKKHVREQEAELELEDEADEFLKTVAKKSSQSSSKASSARSQSKSKLASSSRSKEAPNLSGEDNGLSAEQETRREKLISLLIIRDEIARKELDSLSLPLLEKIWTMGESANAKLPAKALTKTPAKRVLSRTSNIQLLGSPLDALDAAKGKPDGAADDSPVASRRKRRGSSSDLDDLDEIVKRPRVGQVDQSSNSKPFKTSRPSSLAPSHSTSRVPSVQSGYSGSTSSRPVSRAGSAAPTMISVSTSSTWAGPSKYNASAGSLPKLGEEMIELSEDEDEVKVVPKGKKHAALERVGKSKSGKPKCGDYTGIPRKLIDATFHRVCAHLGHDGMFPDDQREYDRLIRKSWIISVKEMGVDIQMYPIEDEHEACVKSRVDSFRGRVRVKIEPSIAKVYHLSSKQGEQLITHVKKLQDGEFHKKPGAQGRAGNYQHPFIAECVHQAFFVGRKPAGILYPELYNPIPIPALAYVCGMIEFLISLYAKGQFDDARAEAAVVGGLYKNHLSNLELFQQHRPNKCEKYRAALYAEAMKLAGKGVKIPEPNRTGPGVLTAEDFEDEDEDEGEGEGKDVRNDVGEDEGEDDGEDNSEDDGEDAGKDNGEDEGEDEGEGSSEADENPKKAAPPAQPRLRTVETSPSKRNHTSSESSDLSNESGSSSGDDRDDGKGAGGGKHGADRERAHPERRATGLTSSCAASATAGAPGDAGNMDVDHGHDSQPRLADEQAAARVANSVGDGKVRDGPHRDSANSTRVETGGEDDAGGSSRDVPAETVAVGKGLGKRKGKQKAVQEEVEEEEEEEEQPESVETKGRQAKTKAKALLETKPKAKRKKARRT